MRRSGLRRTTAGGTWAVAFTSHVVRSPSTTGRCQHVDTLSPKHVEVGSSTLNFAIFTRRFAQNARRLDRFHTETGFRGFIFLSGWGRQQLKSWQTLLTKQCQRNPWGDYELAPNWLRSARKDKSQSSSRSRNYRAWVVCRPAHLGICSATHAGRC